MLSFEKKIAGSHNRVYHFELSGDEQGVRNVFDYKAAFWQQATASAWLLNSKLQYLHEKYQSWSRRGRTVLSRDLAEMITSAIPR